MVEEFTVLCFLTMTETLQNLSTHSHIGSDPANNSSPCRKPTIQIPSIIPTHHIHTQNGRTNVNTCFSMLLSSSWSLARFDKRAASTAEGFEGVRCPTIAFVYADSMFVRLLHSITPKIICKTFRQCGWRLPSASIIACDEWSQTDRRRTYSFTVHLRRGKAQSYGDFGFPFFVPDPGTGQFRRV